MCVDINITRKQQREIDSVREEKEDAAIAAYKRGRQDLANEEKLAKIEKKTNGIVKRNTILLILIKGATFIFLIAAIISLLLLFAFGFLKSDSANAKFFNEYGWFITLIGSLLSVFGFVFDIKSIKNKLLPIDKDTVRKNIEKNYQ